MSCDLVDSDACNPSSEEDFGQVCWAVANPRAGTDLTGGSRQLKALLESGSKGNSDNVSKTVWILSDMMNESANPNMPALLSAGPEKMIERVRTNGMMVPLAGYRVYVMVHRPRA
jgi:hypothetical protein